MVRRLMVVSLVLVLAVLACDGPPPSYTPPPPQVEAMTLNATYETASAQPTLTATSRWVPYTDTPTPTDTLTPGILEVTATCDYNRICELGTPVNWMTVTPIDTPTPEATQGTPGVEVTPLGGTDAQ